MPPACPLCRNRDVRFWRRVMGAAYYRCSRCFLTFLDPARWPDPEAERTRYLDHENGPHDAGYRRFLAKLAEPVAARIPEGAAGLDFGCGPGPTLSVMLRERGYAMTDHDPFFRPDPAALARRYDFITCSEVIEHVHDPPAVLGRLDALLKPGGLIGLMTGMVDDSADFANWHYVRDPTHVAFYHPDTMAWIAETYGWALERPSWTVTLFRKPSKTR